MTQQDETANDAAADQSALSFPSPYLEASEAAPQAYLAPPQPGQPGYGHSGNRSSASTMARDPAAANPFSRLAASFVDWIIIYIVSGLPYWSPLLRIMREVRAIMASFQGQSTPEVRAAVSGLFADPSTQHVMLYWILTLFGIALAYYWVQHAAWGATFGKRALGLRVVRADDQARIGVKAAGVRTFAFLAGPAMLLAPASPVIVAGGVLWIADAGLAMLDPRAQCLHDKVAGTLVVKKRWLDERTRPADS